MQQVLAGVAVQDEQGRDDAVVEDDVAAGAHVGGHALEHSGDIRARGHKELGRRRRPSESWIRSTVARSCVDKIHWGGYVRRVRTMVHP